VRPGIAAKRHSGPFRLLAVNRYFLEKGGLHALRVYDALKDRFDVQITVISDAPEGVRRSYASDPNVRILPPHFSRPELMQQFYSQSDALLHLTFSDTFGFVILEAMSAGLPVVSTDMFSLPEVVNDSKTGFIVKGGFSSVGKDGQILYHASMGNWPEFLQRVEHSDVHIDAAKKVAELIDDTALHRHLSSGALKEVQKGKFSIETRNAALRKAYTDALGI
jgi:glycosyltransferase involved in cell wall biosynthesis